MALVHPTTTRTQDADLILCETQMMKMIEVLSYYSFCVNNSMLACLHGSIISSQRLTIPCTTCPSGFIAKQVPDPLGLYSKRELTVKTLWHDLRMMVSHTLLIVPFVAKVPLSWSVNPSHQKTEKSEGVSNRFGLARCGVLGWQGSSRET